MEKVEIIRGNGEKTIAWAPVVISASRSTDIPAFYSDWFFHRLKMGYSAWCNPFNGQVGYVSYEMVKCVVFWSKNPLPLLKYIDELKLRNIHSYIQFTLNDYVHEGWEEALPPLGERIDTFRRAVDKFGYGCVVWRFDPLMLSDGVDVDILLERIANIGDKLKGYTEQLVFSFADIAQYAKVRRNLDFLKVKWREFNDDDINRLACGLMSMNQSWDYKLSTCGESVDLKHYGIEHGSCIDANLMRKHFAHDAEFMAYLTHAGGMKDKGQRKYCGCIEAKDIGAYNTCPHGCVYCYANSGRNAVDANCRRHRLNPYSEFIAGE